MLFDVYNIIVLSLFLPLPPPQPLESLLQGLAQSREGRGVW